MHKAETYIGLAKAPGLDLDERERIILRSIIHNFILNASPVGSRTLARRLNLGLSPATIRNVMADLEDMGLLTHPHTSAGRVPTDMGYRHYVSGLMEVEELTDEERNNISSRLDVQSPEADNLYDSLSLLLSEISRLLAVILTPDMSGGKLERVEIVRVSSSRVTIIVVVSSGLVNSILLEIDSAIPDEEIQAATQYINQRLAGLKLSEIKQSIKKRLSDNWWKRSPIVRMFLDMPERIFTAAPGSEMRLGGARRVIEQPEYSSPEGIKGIIELIDDRDIIVHLLKGREPGISVTIGDENRDVRLKDLSVITSTYRSGDASGTLGIIGPTRMNYAKLVALVDFTAKLVSERAEGRTI